nr:synaptobrevin, longin-like domain protein [Tanacetum cinerariifolium]
MFAILEKSKHNVDFHPIVDFIEASPLRYALTVKPTVYISHIQQFWSTARIETTKEGTKILATVDGILRTVTESSLRRNLKLQDEEGISQFSHQWKYLIYTIMQCLSPKSTGFNEFSSNIATTLVCLATNRTYNFSKIIFDGLVKNVNNKGEGSGTLTEPYHTPSPEAHPTSHNTYSSPTLPPVTTASIPTVTPSETTTIRQCTRRARIAQSSTLPPVADEPVSPLRDVSEGEAFPTESSLRADQDRATIAKTSTLPHDSAPMVTSHAAAEGKDRERVDAERFGDDAQIKGRNLDEGEVVAERVSDDTEEMATVLTSMETITVLASGAAEVPTGSGCIPTTGSPAADVPTDSDVVPTASLVFATATVVTPYRRTGKEIMVESKTLKKKKVQEQIDAQVVRELEEQMAREDQRMSEQEYEQFAGDLSIRERAELINNLIKYQENYAQILKFQTQQRKPWSKKQKTDYYMAVIKSNLGWKESVKKLKTSKEVLEEAKSPDEVLKEKVKEMMQLVLIKEVYVESLQVKHPIIDWKVHTEGHRSYWKIIRLGGSSTSYQFCVDLLKHMDREDLNQLWALVKESLSNRQPTSDKKMEL